MCHKTILKLKLSKHYLQKYSWKTIIFRQV